MIRLNKNTKKDGVYYTPYSGGAGYHIIKDGILYKDIIITGCFTKVTEEDVITIFNNR